MRKKLVSLLVAAALTLSLIAALPGTAAAAVTQGVDVASLTQGSVLSPQTVYTVSNVAGLERLAELTAAGIDFTGCTVYLTADVDLAKSAFAGIGTPGYPYAQSVSFNGTFNGQGHTVSGIRTAAGLFGCIGPKGAVLNLTVNSAISHPEYVGGIAVYNYGLVESCTNLASLSNSDKNSAVGGIVGANYGTVRGCQNRGDINGSKAGGIVGIEPTGANVPKIDGCVNRGAVTGNSSAGGILGTGLVTGYIQNCENYGVVNGIGSMGGVAGMISNAVVRNCANHAQVGGTGDMGGLVGTAAYGSAIYNSFSSASAEGAGRAGGLVGQKADGILENSYWLYDITNTPVTGTKDAVGNDFNSSQTANCSCFDFGRSFWVSEGTRGVFLGSNESAILYTDLTSALNGWVLSFGAGECYLWRLNLAENSYPMLLRQAVAPMASPMSGGFDGSLSVTLTSATPDAEIRYTLDGSNPTNSSTLYRGPITLTATTTVKAIACKNGMENSSVLTATYTRVGGAAAATPGMVALRSTGGLDVVVRKSLVIDGKIFTASGETAGLSAAQRGKSFIDVAAGSWYADAVAFVTARDLFLGVSETEFAPDATMTRAMLVTVMHRLEDTPQAQSERFEDVPAGSYYENAVAWGSSTGLIKGIGENLFAPNEAITREQLITILYRYAEAQGCDVSARGELSDYADGDALSDYASDALRWAVGSGVFFSETGRLDAKEPATRAQVARMLLNFGNLYWVS
ncbi:MAG: chitobiase/beta-hexosaminidase C-terminal domain-containing protein [Clostridia bacterium]|nr:chitobiase/beta-hexosaminidase C-terminal domain-containing protein [Clostridia bacterium]